LSQDRPKTFPTLLDQGLDGDAVGWVDLTLEPATTYALWIGTPEDPLLDAYGRDMAPYLLTFRTAAR
jgi:hypothetical protein